jgi:hypothetical protein
MEGREEKGGVHIMCLETYDDRQMVLRTSKSDMATCYTVGRNGMCMAVVMCCIDLRTFTESESNSVLLTASL